MNEIVKSGVTLLVVALLAGTALGAVNAITKEKIEHNILAEKEESMKKVLPDAQQFTETVTGEQSGVVSYAKGKNPEGTAGYVFTMKINGYSGEMTLFVGIDKSGKITGVSLGDNNETPGLGKNAENESFSGQFKGKSGHLSVTKSDALTDTEIEAITAATISSRAVTNGVNTALEFFEKNLKN
jgi:electron transport complex protein RnfG